MALDQIYQFLEGQITGALAGRYAAVQGLVAGPLQTAMAINLVIVGFAIMRGVTNEPFGNYLSTWLKAYLVILAATSSLAPSIAAAAQSLPDQLATALGGNMATSFDTFVANAINPAQAIHDNMEPWTFDIWLTEYTIPNLVTLAVLLVMIFIAYVVAVIAMTMILFVKFGLFVTIAVMPIFVGALIFPSSSGLFFSWLGAVLNYAVQTAAITLILVFVVSIVSAIPGQVGVGGGADEATTLLAVEAMVLQICAVLVGGFLVLLAQSIGSFAGGGGASGAGLLSAFYPTTLQRRFAGAGFGAGPAIRGVRRGAGAMASGMATMRERRWASIGGGRTSLGGASSATGRP